MTHIKFGTTSGSRRCSTEKFTGNCIVNILFPTILANSGGHFLYHQSKPVTLKGYPTEIMASRL